MQNHAQPTQRGVLLMSWDDSDDDWGTSPASPSQTDTADGWGDEADPWKKEEAGASDPWNDPDAGAVLIEDAEDPWAYPEAEAEKPEEAEPEPVAAPSPEPEPVASLSGPAALAAGKELLGPESKSPDVALMQQGLLALGFRLELSRSFDKASLNAVQTFQMQRKLPITGRLDARSRAELAKAWEQRLSQTKTAAVAKTAALPTVARPSHPEELPRFETLKAKSLSEELGPQSPSKPASEGPEVQLLQKLLIINGCELNFNGIFDKATYNAVRKLQPKYQLPITGLIDARTREKFNQLIEQAQEFESCIRRLWYVVYPYRKLHQLPVEDEWEQVIQAWLKDLLDEALQHKDPGMQELPEQLHSERPLLTSLLGTPGQLGAHGQQVVSRGIEVERLQEALLELGYKLKVNQQFDLQTFDALKQFQQAQGLAVSGMADPATRELLNASLKTRYELETAYENFFDVIRGFQRQHDLKTSATLEKRFESVLDQLLHRGILPIRGLLGPMARAGIRNIGPDVLLLKCFLRQQGFELEASMIFDQATSAAIKSFQKQHALPMSGTLDAKTLEFVNDYWLEQGLPLAEEEELIY